MNRKRKICLYCEDPGRKITGEHVIPETIGGHDEIKSVCAQCNNGELSKLDTELCYRSPVALIAASEIGDKRVLHELWTIDEQQHNLLVEGQWDPNANTHMPYPQLIIEGERAQLRADGDEIREVGEEKFKQVFIDAAQHAYKEYLRNRKRLFFEQVDRKFFPQHNRLPPRIFSRHRLTELKVGDTFVLKYVDEADKRQLLDKLSKGNLFKPSGHGRTEFYPGSRTLAFQVMFSPATIGRAFMKIGINSLAWVCEKTEVTNQNFSEACDLVTGRVMNDQKVESKSGFVRAADLSSMECPRGEHRIWIIRDGKNWTVRISFFGGRIGGTTTFLGASNEDWNFAEIRCPINSPMEIVRKSALYVANEVPVQSGIFQEIAPTIEAFNAREGRFLVPRKIKSAV